MMQAAKSADDCRKIENCFQKVTCMVIFASPMGLNFTIEEEGIYPSQWLLIRSATHEDCSKALTKENICRVWIRLLPGLCKQQLDCNKYI